MVKISGLSSLLPGRRDEPQTKGPRQFGGETPATVQPEGRLEVAENTDTLMNRRTALKHLQEARSDLLANYNAKRQLADKAESIAAGIKDRLANFSDLTDQIDAFYQQQIDASIATDGHTAFAELPEHIAARKREYDGLESQIVVAENCAKRRREEAREAHYDLERLAYNREAALHDVMSYIAEIHAANIDRLWGLYANEVVSLWALTRQQLTQCDIYNSSTSEKPIYKKQDLTVSNRALAASMGYPLDRNRMASQYVGKLDADGRKWSKAIERLREDAYADCSDLCPELPGIPEAG